MIGQKISHYEILEKLGQGGMGVVYKAHDTKLDRVVALKFLPPHMAASEQDRARFVQEAKAAAALNHPNICSVIDIDEFDGPNGDKQLFIVMEFVDGQTLKDHIASAGASLQLRRAIEIGTQIAEGLAAAHEKGIVHRDIKPENIMIRKDGIAQIMDFGLAKLKSSGSKITRLTKEGSTIGTAGYMSPEQVQGQNVDHRSDIFSLGVVLYEMIAGQMPFKGVHETALMYEIVNVDPAPMTSVNPSLDPELDVIVLDCLEKDPKDRCQSVAEVARDLRRVKRDTTRQRHSRVTQVRGVAAPAAPQYAAAPARDHAVKRFLWPVLAGIFALLFAGAAILWWNLASVPKVISRWSLSIPKALDMNINSYTGIAISPDGSRIVFRAGGKLYQRLIGSYETSAIAGTEEGSSPFFSPDGQWLAFFAGGKLKKSPLVGGTPIILADAPDNRGGSWGADGTIYFTPGSTTGIMKIPAEGGTPTPVTNADSTVGERTHRFPFLLPGGKTLIYTVGSLSSPDYYEDATIAGIDLRTGKRSVIVKGSSFARYIAPGYLVYTHNGTLFSVSFDPDRLQTTGSAVPVVDGIRGDPTTGAMDLDISGTGTLVYFPGKISAENRTLAMMDFTGHLDPLSMQQQFYIEPRVSPLGNQVACVIQSGKDFDVWLYDLARSTLSRFTFGGTNRSPTWSPDGSRIAYWSSNNGKPLIVIKRADGSGEPQTLETGLGRTYIDAWTHDGSTLVVDRLTTTSQSDIYAVPVSSNAPSKPVISTQYDEWMGSVSPDGKWIAYCSNESEKYQIYIQPYPSGGGKWQVTSEEAYEPRWSSDGKVLYYYSPGHLKAVDIQTTPSLTIGKPRSVAVYTLFPVDSGISYDLMPDGKHIVTTETNEEDNLTHEINVVLNWTDEVKQRMK